MHTILVLGGYGFFGSRIAEGLARRPGLRLLIGGRDSGKARRRAVELGLPYDAALVLDAAGPGLAQALRAARVDTLIHTAGPFQGQDHAVARAAIEAGCNYIDLGDGRDFVAGIRVLDEAARRAGVAVISGASSVPALSSAAIDRYLPAFSRLDEIRIGIASGARSPGLATVRGIFGYCGKPFRRLESGVWKTTHGWLDLDHYDFPAPLGRRWLGSCDVPDLSLFPERYAPVQSVSFQAGFASTPGHLVVWALAAAVKAGVLASMLPFAGPLNRISRWIEPLVSDRGCMFVRLGGLGPDGQPLVKRWHVLAARNHGPYIPCGASIALARRLAAGQRLAPGAYPCMGLLSVDEYLSPLGDLDVHQAGDAL